MHHLASTFQLLKEPGCALFSEPGCTLDLERRKELRTRIVGMVLATDLAVNFPTINQFKQMVADKTTEMVIAEASRAAVEAPLGQPTSSSASRMSSRMSLTDRTSSRKLEAADKQTPPSLGRRGSSRSLEKLKLRQLLEMRAAAEPNGGRVGGLVQVGANEELLILKMVLKVSDIGNVSKGHDYCLAWTERVVQEFFAQGDLEAEMEIPVTPMMNKSTACVPKQQIGFYNFVARPMYEAFDALVSMEQPLANLDVMQQYWTAKLPKEAEAESPA